MIRAVRTMAGAGPGPRPAIGRDGGRRQGRSAARPAATAAGDLGRRSRASAPTRRRPLLRAAGLLAALGLAVLVLGAATRPDGRAHVVVLDVGQGDAILVTGPTGGRMLVDGGPDPDRLLVALDGRLPPWDRRLDLVVATHPHEDHVAGLPLVLERYRVGQVAEPGMPGRGPGYQALATALATRAVGHARLATGSRFVLDGIAVEVLWPDAAQVPAEPSDDGSVVNDSSIVLLGTFEGRRFLLAGDAEADVEARLVARGLPTVDLLKAGHHGSRTSTSDALVAATRPRVAAISVGARNDYGHPSREVLARLVAAGATVLRTDLVGTIDVALDAHGVEVRTEHPAPVPARGSARSADPTPSRRRPGPRPGSRMIEAMSVPTRAAAAALLVSLDPPAWHLRHVRAVAEIAGFLAMRCAARGELVDRALVEAAALLHDVDKILPRSDPVRALRHGEGSAAWLVARGFGGARAGGGDALGDPPRRWRGRRLAGDRIARGASSSAYADKRAGQRLESMDARFAGWRRRYPGRLERRGRRGRPGPGRAPRAGRLPLRRRRAGACSPPALDGAGTSGGTARTAQGVPVTTGGAT